MRVQADKTGAQQSWEVGTGRQDRVQSWEVGTGRITQESMLTWEQQQQQHGSVQPVSVIDSPAIMALNFLILFFISAVTRLAILDVCLPSADMRSYLGSGACVGTGNTVTTLE